MEREDFTLDTIGYESVIREVFPKGLIERVSNFDDVCFGWEICPRVGTMITFKVKMGNELEIDLDCYVINPWTKETERTRIFHGRVPANTNNEPDFEFLKTLLMNYKWIG